MHEDNSSYQLDHEISPISEEPLQLSNMIVEVENSNETSDKDGFHPVRSSEINNNSYPQTMCDSIQASKCNSTIVEISGTYQGVEALQLLLMVMLGSHNSSKPLELIHIWFLSHNPSLCMVSLNENLFRKDVWYFRCNISNF